LIKMEKLNYDKKTLKKFGITMGVAFAVIALAILARHKHSPVPVLLVSAAWFIFAFSRPGLLKPLYIIWMKFAFILSWINTRIILFVIFYLLFTPMGIVMRIFGVDLLNRRIEKDKGSYWQKALKKEFSKPGYERQF